MIQFPSESTNKQSSSAEQQDPKPGPKTGSDAGPKPNWPLNQSAAGEITDWAEHQSVCSSSSSSVFTTPANTPAASTHVSINSEKSPVFSPRSGSPQVFMQRAQIQSRNKTMIPLKTSFYPPGKRQNHSHLHTKLHSGERLLPNSFWSLYVWITCTAWPTVQNTIKQRKSANPHKLETGKSLKKSLKWLNNQHNCFI